MIIIRVGCVVGGVVVECVLESAFARGHECLEKVSTRLDRIVARANSRFVKVYRVMMLKLRIAVRLEVDHDQVVVEQNDKGARVRVICCLKLQNKINFKIKMLFFIILKQTVCPR